MAPSVRVAFDQHVGCGVALALQGSQLAQGSDIDASARISHSMHWVHRCLTVAPVLTSKRTLLELLLWAGCLISAAPAHVAKLSTYTVAAGPTPTQLRYGQHQHRCWVQPAASASPAFPLSARGIAPPPAGLAGYSQVPGGYPQGPQGMPTGQPQQLYPGAVHDPSQVRPQSSKHAHPVRHAEPLCVVIPPRDPACRLLILPHRLPLARIHLHPQSSAALRCIGLRQPSAALTSW